MATPLPPGTASDAEPAWLVAGLRAILVVFIGLAAILETTGGPDRLASTTIQVAVQVGVLAVLAATASTAWFVERLGLGAPVVAAGVAAAAAVAASIADREAGLAFLPYLLVPCLLAGLRGGVLWALGTVAAGETTYGLSFLLVSDDTGQLTDAVTRIASWTLLGIVVGGLGAWVRFLEARSRGNDAAYASAHRLLSELWLLSRQLSAGLDPVTLAHAILDDVRERVPAVRSALFVRSRGGFLVPLAVDGAETVDWDTSTSGESLLGAAWTSGGPVQEPRGFAGQAHLHRVAFPLRMGVRTFGVVALETARPVDGRDLTSAMDGAEESALRLETALLFADVRSVASSEERRRLAREIHDGVAQELTSLGYAVDDLVDRSADPAVASELRELRAEVTRVISELRLSIFDLRSDVSSGSGLGSALSDYVQQVGAAASGPTIHLVLDESPHRLRSDTEVEVLRIAQEAITNARKHAQAANLWVSAVVRPPDALLRIEDDGVGLGEGRPDSFGLDVMRERATRIGAELRVERGPGGGTRIVLRLGDPPALPSAEPPLDTRSGADDDPDGRERHPASPSHQDASSPDPSAAPPLTRAGGSEDGAAGAAAPRAVVGPGGDGPPAREQREQRQQRQQREVDA